MWNGVTAPGEERKMNPSRRSIGGTKPRACAEIPSRHRSRTAPYSGSCSTRLSTIHEPHSDGQRAGVVFDEPLGQGARELQEARQLEKRVPAERMPDAEGLAVEVGG